MADNWMLETFLQIMLNNKYFKPTTALLMALSLSTVVISPLVNITPASAQLFPPQDQPSSTPRSRNETYRNETYRNETYKNETYRNDRNYSSAVIPRGSVIPVEYDREKILVTPEETVPVTLFVAANIKNSRRQVLIPYDSEVVGRIEPSGDGSRFVAEELIFPDGTTYTLEADSQVVTRTEKVKKGADAGDILKGAAIGGAAATVLAEIFGDIDFLEVLGGAGAGAVAGLLLGGKEVELISIDPNNDLDLTLQSDLVLR